MQREKLVSEETLKKIFVYGYSKYLEQTIT